jgi:putative ABC transport system ATP-binding protein
MLRPMTTTPAAPAEPMTATAIVATADLRRRYGEGPAAVDALAGVSVDIRRGEYTAIMGASGSGKSTLMHLMAGLDTPTAGTVTLDGVQLDELDDRRLTELRRDKVGFVFQAFNLLPVLTAEENLVLPLTIAGRKPDAEWLESLVQTVGLGDRRTHRPSELSGGQQQRVAVARALVSKPAVVFADEPTGNLDSAASTEVLQLLRRAVDDYQQTVVMVTHDPAAAAYADRLIVLADGRVASDGTP